jgi:hypothetical protein
MRMSTAVASDYLKAGRDGLCPIAWYIAHRSEAASCVFRWSSATSRRRVFTRIALTLSCVPHNYLSPSANASTDKLFYALIARAAICFPAMVSMRASGLPMSSRTGCPNNLSATRAANRSPVAGVVLPNDVRRFESSAVPDGAWSRKVSRKLCLKSSRSASSAAPIATEALWASF